MELLRKSWFVSQFEIGINKSLEYTRPNMVMLALMVTFGFPFFYIVWVYWFPQPYENLWLRLLGSLIYFPLIFHKNWPKRWQPFLPHLWALAILYSLGFFFSFMLFKNDFNEVWVLSTMTGMVLLVFVSYDWLMMLVFYLAGMALVGLGLLLSGDMITQGDLLRYAVNLPIYSFVFFFGAIFNHTKESIYQEKQQTAFGTGESIAHELRTPLIAIRSAAEGFVTHLPVLMKGYENALARGEIERIHPGQYRQLSKIPDTITKEIDFANTIISMLLFNSNNDYVNTSTFQHHSLVECIETSLDTYPFKDKNERDKVKCDLDDFLFWGNDVYLRNVLFNLLNNALYFIADGNNGEIKISCGENKKNYFLYFKDTGKGIKAEDLVKIFEPFYTKGKHGGTGIGLSFCKQVMESFKGSISCESEVGVYTEFRLTFPKIKR